MFTTEVLLITACINPKATQDVVVRDSTERLRQYLASLIAWIKLTDIKTIVFCENSNTDYDFARVKHLAEQEGKALEVLIFDGNQEAQKHGKGYGEGKIIKYAIENSQYLNDQVNFYKITGRLYVPNFSQFRQLHSNLPNVFRTSRSESFGPPKDHPWVVMDSKQPETVREHIRAMARFLYIFSIRGRKPHRYTNQASTIFYKSNVAFFKKYLINSYKRVDETKSYVIEHIFYENLERTQFSEFLGTYDLCGICAGTGIPYSQQDYPEEITDLALSLSKF